MMGNIFLNSMYFLHPTLHFQMIVVPPALTMSVYILMGVTSKRAKLKITPLHATVRLIMVEIWKLQG